MDGLGVEAGLSSGLGGDERALSLGGDEEEEELCAWLSSVRYLWGLRRILGGSGVLAAALRCCRRRVKWTFWLWFCRVAARVTALGRSWSWSLCRRGGGVCELLTNVLSTCRALERSADPLVRTFLEFSFRRMRLEVAEDEDEATPLKTRREEDCDEDDTRIPDDERRSAAGGRPLSSLLRRLTSAEIGPSATFRRREVSSPLRSTGPRRVSRCPPDATTPLHLSQSTCRGRSLMAFMMEVGSSQR